MAVAINLFGVVVVVVGGDIYSASGLSHILARNARNL